MTAIVTNEEVLLEMREIKAILLMRLEGAIATPDQVTGTYGDPQVKFEPKTWRGGGVSKGKKMSACRPEFLVHYARALSNMADKDDREKKVYKGKPASIFGRADAARARRWALDMQLGNVAAPEAETPATGSFGASDGFGASGFGEDVTPPEQSGNAPPSSQDLNDDEEEEDAPL